MRSVRCRSGWRDRTAYLATQGDNLAWLAKVKGHNACQTVAQKLLTPTKCKSKTYRKF
jgi:hypothetical protein